MMFNFLKFNNIPQHLRLPSFSQEFTEGKYGENFSIPTNFHVNFPSLVGNPIEKFSLAVFSLAGSSANFSIGISSTSQTARKIAQFVDLKRISLIFSGGGVGIVKKWKNIDKKGEKYVLTYRKKTYLCDRKFVPY